MAKAIYTEKRKGPPCRLSQADLISLEKIIRTNFDQESTHFRISTTLPAAHIDAKSSEDLFQSDKVPATLTDLYFSCSDFSWSKHDRRVTVGFYTTTTPIEVVSDDQEWAVGRCEAIVRFLMARRPWYWPLIRATQSPYWQLIIYSLFIGITTIFFLSTSRSTAFTISYLAVSVVLCIIYALYLTGFLSQNIIYVRPKTRDEAKVDRVYAIIGIIVATIPIILWFIDKIIAGYQLP